MPFLVSSSVIPLARWTCATLTLDTRLASRHRETLAPARLDRSRSNHCRSCNRKQNVARNNLCFILFNDTWRSNQSKLEIETMKAHAIPKYSSSRRRRRPVSPIINLVNMSASSLSNQTLNSYSAVVLCGFTLGNGRIELSWGMVIVGIWRHWTEMSLGLSWHVSLGSIQKLIWFEWPDASFCVNKIASRLARQNAFSNENRPGSHFENVISITHHAVRGWLADRLMRPMRTSLLCTILSPTIWLLIDPTYCPATQKCFAQLCSLLDVSYQCNE